LNTLLADGNDADDVFAKATYAIAELRNSSLPYFLELPTYRWREHCGPGFDNDIGYRSEAEFQAWKLKDPIELSKSRMPAYSINDSMARFRDEIQAAFEYAINQPFADISAASANVYAHSGYETDNIRLKTSRHITYREAILEAQDIALESFSNAYIMGLGVPDPKGIFGTTLGLQSKYGHDRVFDIPLSENALTGVAIGSAVTGQRPILIHQRVDFSLVSIDQIVNQAAKWHYMFNGKMAVPLVIRMIIGRGWGQGPQHSQSLHSWFAHVPGLKVVMPVTPYDAKGMLLSAVEDNNPVLILEHRWLHGLKDEVPLESYKVSLDKSRIIARGNDITIVGISYATIECIEAAKILEKNGVKVEVIDLRSIRPLDKDTLLASVSKTRRLLVVDHSEAICGIAGEIIATVAENMSHSLRSKPVRLTLPDHPVPTSHYLAEHYYPTSDNIIQAVASMLQLQDVVLPSLANHIVCKDQPNSFFNGPF
jgi:pyruvate dehydrogenase E1 component beta subunit